jgi:hypothetical protein
MGDGYEKKNGEKSGMDMKKKNGKIWGMGLGKE